MSGIRYRADVDGLRAVAVLAVVAFHSGIGFPGGFVGVDVFFVISGFLITSIVAADLERREFSLATFWARRIRRIWPAAAVMTAMTLLIGAAVMLPNEYSRTAGDAVAHVAMLANVRFCNRLDYFVESADTVPLLHLWSLAVEEQFYLFFPLLLWALARRGRRVTLAALGAVAAASLVGSVAAVAWQPSSAFFLLPYRAWELIAGSVLALVRLPGPRGYWADVMGWAGITAILTTCMAYDRVTPFPGLAALPPCLGAMGVIAAGTHRTSLLQRTLGSEPLRGIGLVSYSLYLWHWPLIALLRYVYGARLSAPVLAAWLVVTALATLLSYRFIETPFRTARSPGGRRRALFVAVGASCATLALGLGINRTRGLPGRFAPATLAALGADGVCRDWEYKATKIPVPNSGDDLLPIGARVSQNVNDEERPCFLFWGDSHGMAVSPAIDRAARNRNLVGWTLLERGTIPLPDVIAPTLDGEQAIDSPRARTAMLEWIRRHRPKHVILCARWTLYLSKRLTDRPVARDEASSAKAFDAGLDRLLEVCNSIDARVWLIREVPYQPLTALQRLKLAELTGDEGVIEGVTSRDEHDAMQQVVVDRLRRTDNHVLNVVDLAAPLFSAKGIALIGADGRLWYADDDHLNATGALVGVAMPITAMFDAMAADCMNER